jgi:hypothetical protein
LWLPVARTFAEEAPASSGRPGPPDPAAGDETAGVEESTDEPLAAEDIRGIKLLFLRLAAAMAAGDADAIGELLSPTLSADERRRIVSMARGEFERIAYRKFSFELGDDLTVDRLGPDRIEILVQATYEYESFAEGQSQMASDGETAYPFRLAKTDGEWRIVWSELVDQFETQRMERFLGWMFLVVFLIAIAVFFWGWMALDAWVRTGTGYSLAVLFTPPVGALVYFFAVYLRRGFVKRGEDRARP